MKGMFKSKTVFTILVSLVIFSGMEITLNAQEQGGDLFLSWFLESDLNPEVSIGGKKTSLLQSTSTIVVIDRQMIDSYNFLTISEALNTVANFNVVRTYLKQNIPTSRGILQDHYATRVLVMINNIPTYHGGTGEGNLDRVNINDVERIEVLKGTGSFLYGNNAFSGAINIILRAATEEAEQSGTFHAGVGEDNAFLGGGNFSYKADEDKKLFVAASVSNEDGSEFNYIDQNGETGNVDEFINTTNVSFYGRYGRHSFLYNGYDVSESYLGVANTFASGAGNPQELQGHLASYTYSNDWTDTSTSKITLFYDWNERDLSRTFDDNTRALITGNRYGASFEHRQALLDNIGLQLGGSYGENESENYQNYNVQTGEILSENFMENRTADEYSIYAQLQGQFDLFTVLFGTKYSDSEFGGDNTSSRGTIVWQFNDTNAIKLIAGESFRNPTLFELYFRTDSGTVYGSTTLKPETSTSIELVYQIISGNLLFQTTAYNATYEDKIFRATGPLLLEDGTLLPSVNRYTNGDTFEADGVEIEMKYVNPDLLNFFMNIGYVDGDSGDDTGDGVYNFKYIPEYTASAGVYGDIGPVSLAVVTNWMDEMTSWEGTVDDSLTWDLNLGIKQETETGTVRHSLTIKNLTDETVGFPEYVRRRGEVTEVPLTVGRKIYYTVKINY